MFGADYGGLGISAKIVRHDGGNDDYYKQIEFTNGVPTESR